MNYKRRYPRRWVRCGMCTPNRFGNAFGAGEGPKPSVRRRMQGEPAETVSEQAWIDDLFSDDPHGGGYVTMTDEEFFDGWDAMADYESWRRRATA